MRWVLISCFLLASARDILTTTPSTTVRPKRDLMSIKNFLLSKLFGSDTVIIPLPNIPKDEMYQLFKIKGYDNVFLKVIRKPKEKVETFIKTKYEYPGGINPEMAILGQYLGTNSESETLMALDMVKNLVKSGILRDEREETVQKVAVPMVSIDPFKNYIIRENIKPVELMKQEIDPIYLQHHVPSIIDDEGFSVVNHHPIAVYPAEYPGMLVGSEVKYRPLQTKFSYKQETKDADMIYESYNNRGVIVTRTNKIPVKPKYISLRLADVASIAANPFLTKSRKTTTTTISGDELKETLKVMPIHSYVAKEKTQKEIQATQTTTTHCPETADELSGYDDSANSNGHPTSFDIYPPNIYESTNAPDFLKDSKVPFDIRDHLTDTEIEKLNKFINAKLGFSKNNEGFTPKPFDESEHDVDFSDEQKKAAGSDRIKQGKIVSSYDIEHDTTDIEIENPKLKQSDVNEIKSGDNLPQNYMYVPPTSAYVPPLPIANALNDDVLPSMPNVQNIVYIPPVTPDTKNIKINVQMANADNSNIHSDPHKYDDYESQSEIYHKNFVAITSTAHQTRPGVTRNPEQLRTNTRYSWSQSPIVVQELETTQKEVTSNATITTSSRKPFIGGQKTNKTTKTSSTFTGGPVV